MMTNARKAELLKILAREYYQCLVALAECDTDEESEFVGFERDRLLADLEYSIKYYEEHKNDTK